MANFFRGLRNTIDDALYTAGDIARAVGPATSELVSNLRQVKKDASAELKPLIRELGTEVTAVASGAASSAVDSVGGAATTAGRYVVDNPGKVAAGVVLVGGTIATGGMLATAAAPAIGGMVSAVGLGVSGGTLSGAAASSAGLAWLGGGSIAAGGAGMAGGTALCATAGSVAGGLAGTAIAGGAGYAASKLGDETPGIAT